MIKYKDVINLGFKRIEANDTVFKDIYGYDYFIVDKTIREIGINVYEVAEWDVTTQKVYLRAIDKDGNIVTNIKTFQSIKTLTKYVNQHT
jgi:hypothetical protein